MVFSISRLRLYVSEGTICKSLYGSAEMPCLDGDILFNVLVADFERPAYRVLWLAGPPLFRRGRPLARLVNIALSRNEFAVFTPTKKYLVNYQYSNQRFRLNWFLLVIASALPGKFFENGRPRLPDRPLLGGVCDSPVKIGKWKRINYLCY